MENFLLRKIHDIGCDTSKPRLLEVIEAKNNGEHEILNLAERYILLIANTSVDLRGLKL